MAKKGILLQGTDLNELARNFLAKLLETGKVKAIVAQKEMVAGRGAYHYMLASVDDLKGVKPFVPYMVQNGATIVSQLTKNEPFDQPVAVVLRPCEVRALVELVKLRQANLDNIYIISFECPGTYSNEDFRAQPDDFPKSDRQIREACQICIRFTPPVSDVSMEYSAINGGLMLIPKSDKGEALLKEVFGENEFSDVPAEHDEALETRLKQAESVRQEKFAEFEKQIAGMDNLMEFFAYCTGCHNCKQMCPICMCRECFFESPAMLRTGHDNILRASEKGAFRVNEIMFFHLGRLAHITPSCIGCGMCTEACPADIKVGLLFSYVAERVQGAFDYEAGRSLDEPLILTTYKEDELLDLAL